MDLSISSHRHPNGAVSSTPQSHRQIPTVEFSPAEIVRHQTASWRGVQAETVQIISREYFEYSFKQQRHLLIAVEQGVRYDGETLVEGLPASNVRNYSRKLILVPAGRKLFGMQNPRLLTRSICVYVEPSTVLVDSELRFAEADLQPRLLFEDGSLWQTAMKLKAQINSTDPSNHIYAEALGGVLAHELLRVQGTAPVPRPATRAGLAAWQQTRVIDFMEAHFADAISLSDLALLVRLSPHHFLRSFKQSFGMPPHRYWTGRRIERAKTLLADPRISVTKVAVDVGFSGTSSFSATFHRVTGRSPSDYRRSLE